MRLIHTLLLSALLACQAAAAQASAPQADEAEAARLTSEVIRLFREGKYDEALPPALKALELRERLHGPDHPSLVSALNNLGAVQLGRKEYEEAERHLRRALALADKHGGEYSVLAADINTHLGLLRSRARDYAEAEGFYLRALALKAQSRGAAPPDLVAAHLNLIEVQLIRRDFAKAAASLDRLVEHLRARPPKKDEAAAERVRGYLCALMQAGEAELARKVRDVAGRLRDPEHAAARDRGEGPGGRRTVPVSGGVLNGRVARRIAPTYPPAALSNRVSGPVLVEITVSEEGTVLEAEAVCGHPSLVRAAVEAVRQWRFTPTLLEGRPVKVTGSVTVNFILR